MVAEPRPALGALSEIKDRALMLSLGRAYLCEEPLLKRLGLSIDRSVERLKGEITAYKKRFPGQFAEDVNTEEILKKLSRMAQRLQKPDQEINEKCTVGELGREMEEAVGTLTLAIEGLTSKVEGETPAFTKTDSVLNLFAWLGPVGDLVGGLLSRLFRIVIPLAVAALLALGYLFVTMEKESSLLEEIQESEAVVEGHRGALSELSREKEALMQQVEALRAKEPTRQTKIEMMDLDVKAHKITEKSRQLEIEIKMHADRIEKNRKRLDQIRGKPLIKRLLRQ